MDTIHLSAHDVFCIFLRIPKSTITIDGRELNGILAGTARQPPPPGMWIHPDDLVYYLCDIHTGIAWRYRGVTGKDESLILTRIASGE